MKIKFKRLLSSVLILCMVFIMLPTVASAEESKEKSIYAGKAVIIRNGVWNYFQTLQEAVEDASDGETIRLLKDISEDEVIIVNKNLTINVDDGVDWAGTSDDAVLIIYGGNVTVNNMGTLVNCGTGDCVSAYEGANVYLDSPILGTTASGSWGIGCYGNSVVTAYDIDYIEYDETVTAAYATGGGVIYMLDPAIKLSRGIGLQAANGGKIYSYGGEIEVMDGYAVEADANGYVEIAGGNYTGKTALYINGGKAKIYSGVFESTYNGKPAITGIYSTHGQNVTIASDSHSRPSSWRTTAQNLIVVDYDFNLEKPASLTVNLSGSYNKIKASWTSVSNATGYAVYYKKGTGSYKLWKRTTGTTLTLSGLSAGAKYTIKVVPYKKYVGTYKTVYAEGSNYITKTCYTLKKIVLNSFSTSGTKVKVRWNNISGETGYQISKSTSKTGTNIVWTYKTTTGTYKLVSATKGKTYYYKVRAYKVINGTKIYGPWSAVKAYKR